MRALAPALVPLLLLAVAGCGGSDSTDAGSAGSSGSSASASPSSRPSASSTTAPTPPPPAPTATTAAPGVPSSLKQQARGSTDTYLDAVSSALAAPSRGSGRLRGTDALTGSALAQVRNQSAELADLGQRVVGRPRVLSSVVTSRTTSPPRMTVAVCLDNSRVRVVGTDGRTVRQPASVKRPTLNILSLAQQGGTWVVTGQTFPDDPDC